MKKMISLVALLLATAGSYASNASTVVPVASADVDSVALVVRHRRAVMPHRYYRRPFVHHPVRHRGRPVVRVRVR